MSGGAKSFYWICYSEQQFREITGPDLIAITGTLKT
jgi:hypothetical protein